MEFALEKQHVYKFFQQILQNSNARVIETSIRRLEELQFKSAVHHAPYPSDWKCQAKGDPQPAQDPMEIPVEAVLCGFFYKNPHEARIGECDGKREPS